ncbi:MAG: glycosyltransferase [Clostridiales bacterium]|nr:glycosyltransferase [Clostridiales bacterium]
MMNPKVSVIIPVYNVKDYLRQCLDSVCAQTLTDIEILCVDDGSTDGSAEIIREYAGEDSRVRVITQENAGAGAARNHGLREARGEYLSFLDSDDFFEENMLEEAVRCIEAYTADFVVFESDQYHMEKDEFVRNSWVLRREDIPPYMPFKHRQLTGNVFKTFVGWAWDKLYRRSFVMEHDLWFQEQRTSNDLLFVFSALVLAKRIAVVYQTLAHQRRGASDSLSVTREKSWFCFYDALIALRKRLVDENIYWELEQDYINYALHFSLWNYRTLAEPTKSRLREKLCGEWLRELGIEGKPREYIYNKGEYDEYLALIGR